MDDLSFGTLDALQYSNPCLPSWGLPPISFSFISLSEDDKAFSAFQAPAWRLRLQTKIKLNSLLSMTIRNGYSFLEDFKTNLILFIAKGHGDSDE